MVERARPAVANLWGHRFQRLGNLVLRYPRDGDPARIIKDLTRLLKTSGIG